MLPTAALLAAVQTARIDKVYVVFSNHLDVGYTLNRNGSSAGAVINEYFHSHFPKAIATGRQARAAGWQYRWMTQSWLVSAFRHCGSTRVNVHGPGHKTDVICPNASAVAAFEEAVRSGDIVWHALPFNAEPELVSKEVFEAMLNLTFAEDADAGHLRRRSMSQRDVPGLTRAAVPLLAAAGVGLISVGENSQCAPVNVPPIFLWRDKATNASVVALFHAFGYGVSPPAGLDPTACNATGAGGCEDDPAVLAYTDTTGRGVVKGEFAPPKQWEHCVEVAAAGAAV